MGVILVQLDTLPIRRTFGFWVWVFLFGAYRLCLFLAGEMVGESVGGGGQVDFGGRD